MLEINGVSEICGSFGLKQKINIYIFRKGIPYQNSFCPLLATMTRSCAGGVCGASSVTTAAWRCGNWTENQCPKKIVGEA